MTAFRLCAFALFGLTSWFCVAALVLTTFNQPVRPAVSQPSVPTLIAPTQVVVGVPNS